MSADVAVEAGIFPVGIPFGFRWQACFAKKRRQQSVGVQRHDVFQVCTFRIFEHPWLQLDLSWPEGGNRVLGGCTKRQAPYGKKSNSFHDDKYTSKIQ